MSSKSKLPKGVTIWKGKKKYSGECPEDIFELYQSTLKKPEPKKTESKKEAK